MALCPECGGKVSPFEVVKLRPGATVRCRWCRARLQIPWWSQAIAGGLFLVGSFAGGIYLGSWYLRTNDPLPLILLAAAVLGLALLAVLIEWLLPLYTLVPRDFRDWKAAEQAGELDGSAEGPDPDDSEDESEREDPASRAEA
jgi:hypothetical protein